MDNPNFNPFGVISPLDIEREVEGKKVTRVVIDTSLETGYWVRRTFTDMDNLLAKLFDLSMTYDMVEVHVLTIYGCNHLYLTLIKCNGNSSNIDCDMMDAISRIEFT